MSSTTLKSTTTLFLLISTLSSIAIAYVGDTDGNPIINGETYYIIPQSKGIGGGLTLAPFSDTLLCPLFITPDKNKTSPGIPVGLFLPTEERAKISVGLPVYIMFQDTPNTCMQQLAWNLTPDPKDPTNTEKGYVATGNNGIVATFTIENYRRGKYYKLKFVPFFPHPVGIDVGIFEKDGFLGINTGAPLPVKFKKAPSHGLAMKI